MNPVYVPVFILPGGMTSLYLKKIFFNENCEQ